MTAFKICFKTIENNYVNWLQYKILTRILGIKTKLLKMKIKADSICRLCNLHDETILHLFVQCPKITAVWPNLTTWIQNKINIPISFTPTLIILGYLDNSNYSKPLNTIILTSKSYIFWCCKNQVNPNPMELQKRIEQCYKEQINELKGMQEKFEKNWILWKNQPFIF